MVETKLINVRLPKTLYLEGIEIVEKNGYANFQEFIKESIRVNISTVKKERVLGNLEKTFGSTKGKIRKPFDKNIKDKIALELVNNLDRQKEIFKKLGL